jgi:hypothetical protein
MYNAKKFKITTIIAMNITLLLHPGLGPAVEWQSKIKLCQIFSFPSSGGVTYQQCYSKTIG